MDAALAEEVIACLSGERRVYSYYRDRYSIGLLRNFVCSDTQGVRSIAAVKSSVYAPLLQKPRVKAVLSYLGAKPLSTSFLDLFDYAEDEESFVISLSLWGGHTAMARRWKQMSRGGYNLVLQMNFSGVHDEHYQKICTGKTPFGSLLHPVSREKNTLAWSRIDIDLESNTALIEEIQTDWLRSAKEMEARVSGRIESGEAPVTTFRYGEIACSLEAMQGYCRFVLSRYAAIWAEAMLWASLLFLKNDIGIRHVFYHTPESGFTFKRMSHDSRAPRSLYMDLPKRFCFVKTDNIPPFLKVQKQQRVRKGTSSPSFFEMRF